jgi:outer membrane lipoprotein carrier protein
MLPAGAYSAETELQDVVATLEAPFKESTPQSQQVLDFAANFSQESHIVSIDRSQYGQGQVAFKFVAEKNPVSLFHWVYQQPSQQEIISNGITLWVYQPDNRQVIVTDIGKMAVSGDNPVMFLSSLGNLSRDFNIAWAEPRQDDHGNYRLSLTPKKDSQLIRRMEVVVDSTAVTAWKEHGCSGQVFPVVQTQVIDMGSNSTTITFDDIRINQGVEASQFNFIVPQGVDLIESTGELQF